MHNVRVAAMAVGVISFLFPVSTAQASTAVPWLSVGGVRVIEPFVGPDVEAFVPVVLGHPTSTEVTFNWEIKPDTAGAGDLVLGSGSGSIPAGGQSVGVPVAVHGDTDFEVPEESAVVVISDVSGATARDTNGFVRIREALHDPPDNGVVMGDITTPEPDSGSVSVSIPVILPEPQRHDVHVSWVVRSQHQAIAGDDLDSAQGSVTIARGTTSASFSLEVFGDTDAEPRETALVEALGATSSQDDMLIRDIYGSLVLLKSDSTGNPLPWTAPRSVREGPPTTVYFESDLGDWVGQGRRIHDTLATSSIDVHEARSADSFYLNIQVEGDHDTRINLYTGTRRLREGTWDNLGRFTTTGGPSMDISHGSAGCNTLRGTAVVDSVSRTPSGRLKRFVVRLEQHCEGDDEALRMYVRYKRGDITMPPPPGDPNELEWQAPQDAVPAHDYLYLESTPGEWVGQGETHLLPIDETVAFDQTRAGLIAWFPETEGGWNLTAGMPEWQKRWTPGLYPLAAGAASNPVKAPLRISAYSRACNEETGWLAVDQRAFDDEGRLMSLRLRFERSCDGGPPMYGQLDWTRG